MSTNNLNISKVAFDLPKNRSNIIKVIGVGGGGGNAVTYMHSEGIEGVDYVICNTDAQDLEKSQVENKIQLGVELTGGLGAGNDPDIGEKAAEESLTEIRSMLENNTKMIFVTAGMGGGTGTGAAPVIAKLAKEMGILTVGLVTTPFRNEGPKRLEQAREGVERLRSNVDSLIVINNNKLTEIYGDFGYRTGLAKANEVLLKGVKGMAEVISRPYTINIDFNDARNVLKDSGTAVMGSGIAEGEGRALKAVSEALNSPLLNDNSIKGAKNALLLILAGKNEVTFKEMDIIKDYIQSQSEGVTDIIEGVGDDHSLGEAISITIIATGFTSEQQKKITNPIPKRIIHTLEEDQEVIAQELPISPTSEKPIIQLTEPIPQEETEIDIPYYYNIEVEYEQVNSEKEVFTIIDKKTIVPTQTKKNDLKVQTKQKSLFEMYPQSTIQEEITDEEPKVYELPLDDTEKINNSSKPLSKKEPIINENGEIIHSLDDYMELEEKLILSRFKEEKKQEKKEIKSENEHKNRNTVGQNVQKTIFSEEETFKVNPLYTPIPENMMKRSRPEILKQYNHFKQQPSRMSLNTDDMGEEQLRNNNSYLHDNVD